MSGFLDGAARALMLALSGFATLAIVGSIAAIPSGMATQQLGIGERAAIVEPEQVEAPPADREPASASEGAAGTLVSAAPEPEPEPTKAERWLEVIACALIAIAGLLAVIALTLMRAVGLLRDRA